MVRLARIVHIPRRRGVRGPAAAAARPRRAARAGAPGEAARSRRPLRPRRTLRTLRARGARAGRGGVDEQGAGGIPPEELVGDRGGQALVRRQAVAGEAEHVARGVDVAPDDGDPVAPDAVGGVGQARADPREPVLGPAVAVERQGIPVGELRPVRDRRERREVRQREGVRPVRRPVGEDGDDEPPPEPRAGNRDPRHVRRVRGGHGRAAVAGEVAVHVEVGRSAAAAGSGQPARPRRTLRPRRSLRPRRRRPLRPDAPHAAAGRRRFPPRGDRRAGRVRGRRRQDQAGLERAGDEPALVVGVAGAVAAIRGEQGGRPGIPERPAGVAAPRRGVGRRVVQVAGVADRRFVLDRLRGAGRIAVDGDLRRRQHPRHLRQDDGVAGVYPDGGREVLRRERHQTTGRKTVPRRGWRPHAAARASATIASV